MIATVTGQRTGPDQGIATVIDTQIVVRGPILEVDEQGASFNVLGQTILVDDRAVNAVPLAVDSIGQTVAVSGFITRFGNVLATRIAIPEEQDRTEWVVNSFVTAVDPDLRRFSINGLDVVYADGLLSAMPAEPIEAGQRLTVSGRTFTDGGELIATGIAIYDPSLPETGGETVVEGLIQIEGNSVSFWDQRIVLLPEVSINGPLATDDYVRVTGSLSGGVLYVSDVVVLWRGGVYDFVGRIDAVDTEARTLTMFGIEFDVEEFRIAWPYIGLDDLTVGEYVQILVRDNLVRSIIRSYGWPLGVVGPDWISGEYFSELSPPTQFTIYGVADFVVQVTALDFFSVYGGASWVNGTLSSELDCGGNTVSAEKFWEVAAQPKLGKTYVGAWGRFEGNLFMAESVYLCTESWSEVVPKAWTPWQQLLGGVQ